MIAKVGKHSNPAAIVPLGKTIDFTYLTTLVVMRINIREIVSTR